MLLSLLLMAPHTPDRILPCTPKQIAVSTDGEDGAFNGMSHSGTLLILRNTGHAACTVPGLPAIGFTDDAGHPLPIARRAPRGMHPGPVVLPRTVPPGGMVSTPLTWVSGPVFPNSVCYDAKRLSVTFGTDNSMTPVSAHICGEAGTDAGFEQPILQTGRARR